MDFQKRERFAVSITRFGRLMSAYSNKIKREKTINYHVSSKFIGDSANQAAQKAPAIVQSNINF